MHLFTGLAGSYPIAFFYITPVGRYLLVSAFNLPEIIEEMLVII